MSRAAATTDVITVKPSNNIYTVLVIVAFLAELIGFLMLLARASTIFTGDSRSLFG